MDIANNNIKIELTSNEEDQWTKVFVKSEPGEYEEEGENNSREVDNQLKNLSNDNNNVSKTEANNFKLPTIKVKKSHNHIGLLTPKNLKDFKINHSELTRFACNICSKGFNKKTELTKHMKIHQEKLPLRCDICKREFLRGTALANHMHTHAFLLKQNNIDALAEKCRFCGKCFLTPKRLKAHLIIHSEVKRYICDFCSRGYNKKMYLKTHMKIHMDKSYLRCHICKRKFPRRSCLVNHMRSHDEVFKKNMFTYADTCRFCGKTFSTPRYLINHLLIHSEIKRYNCDTCSKGFNNKHDIRRHVMTHLESHHRCDICQREFINRCAVVNHMRSHANRLKKNTDKYLNKAHLKCHVCKEVFFKPSALAIHMRSHIVHPIQWEGKIDKEKFDNGISIESHEDKGPYNKNSKCFSCDICFKTFMTRSYLDMHRRTHWTNLFECDICKRKFTTRLKIENHIISHIGDGGPLKCDQCDLGFTFSQLLRRHLQEHKSFDCQVCEESFSTKSNLSNHMRIHQGKPFACDICGRRCETQYGLNKHKGTHLLRYKFNRPEKTLPVQVNTSTASTASTNFSSEKTSLECEVCKKKFPDSYRMKLHMIAHTGDGGPEKCSVCGKGFSITYILKIHMQSHKNKKPDTAKRPFECDVCKKKFRFDKNLKSHKMIHVKDKTTKISEKKIGFEQSAFVSGRLKSEIKSKVQGKKNLKGGKANFKKISNTEKFMFHSVKREPCDPLDLSHEINVEDIKIKVEVNEMNEM